MRSKYSPGNKQKAAAHSSWNKVANWYADHLSGSGTYQETTIFPGALRLLQPKNNQRYLDIACGEGSFLQLIRSRCPNAELYGLDAAPGLIGHAQTKFRTDKKIHLETADAQSFGHLVPAHSIHGATCLMAIQNIEQIEPVFKAAAQILVPGGALILVMNHPCFRAPQQSGWGFDEARKIQYRRMDRYLNAYAQPIIAHPGSAPAVKTISYHRPLSTYVQALSATGFAVDSLEEWISDKKSDSGPRAKAENIARNEFPLFLAISAHKI
ncbi:class I SAM-dependent methyltransferase [Patescibacteria group bacterium]|nr:class I SAM-dependent methyltransferase [Patescibacteria group bacterium]